MEEFFINNNSLTETKLFCRKCKKCVPEIESHHVWCKFMGNPHGYTFKEGQPNRYSLCCECHKEVKEKIVLPILNKWANTLKTNKSEYWLWNNLILQKDKPKIIEEIVDTTIKWVEKEKKDDDTKTTPD